jgi:hypothetical protein
MNMRPHGYQCLLSGLAMLSLSLGIGVANAQPKLEPVDYYVSPYPHAVEIDPLGDLLGRVGARYEYRVDPLLSRYFDFSFQKNLNHDRNGIITPAISAGYGTRIYLRDNAAMVGLFVGVNLGVALVNHNSINALLSMEIGYKLTFGSKSPFFIEPELLTDAYLFHHNNASKVFPYVAVPVGFLW